MYRSFEPIEDLSPYVECYWSWQVEADDLANSDILPDAAPEFIVHLGSVPFVQDDAGEWRQQPRAFLYCAAHEALTLSLRGPMSLFAVRFRPWGVSRFSGTSMAAMLDRPVPPSESLNELGDELEKVLSLAGSDPGRVTAVDELLGRRLQKHSRIERRLKMLLDATDGGRASSAEIARKLSVSDRTFNRLWNEVVGLQPRKYVKLMRFHNALEMIERGVALKQVAADCGYSDQAHMARQIKAIAGLPPSSLRRRLGERIYSDLYKTRPDAPWHRREQQSSRK